MTPKHCLQPRHRAKVLRGSQVLPLWSGKLALTVGKQGHSPVLPKSG